jgi:hypothetical protein
VTLGTTYDMTHTNPLREPDDRRCDADTRCHLLRRWAYKFYKIRRWQTDADLCDAYRQWWQKILFMYIICIYVKYMFCRRDSECPTTEYYPTEAERRDTYRRNADFNSKSGQEEHRDAIQDDTHKPTPSFETPKKIPNIAYMSLVKAQDKTLANRRQASRHPTWRGLKFLYTMYMSLGKPQDMTLANRCLSSRRRLKIPFQACMSRGNPQDKRLSKRRRASQRLSSRSWLKIHDPREISRHDTSKTTPIAAASNQDAIGNEHEPRKPQDTLLTNRHRESRRVSDSRFHFCEHEPREATRHDAGKPLPSFVTPLVAMPTQNTKPSQEKPREWHGTMLAKRWAASRRQSSGYRNYTPYLA